MRRLTTDKEIAIVKIVVEKEEKLDEEDMIVVRKIEEMVPRCLKRKSQRECQQEKPRIMP